jgi:putative phosphoesterase
MLKGSDTKKLKIGLISDTHGWLDDLILRSLESTDEIWHAGDIGTAEVAEKLASLKPLRAVYGNIDGDQLRKQYPEFAAFTVGGIKVLMTHIGGSPGKYNARVKAGIEQFKPDVFICGHSHILKVARDGKMLHINPGAAGRQGFHLMRTLVLLEIADGKLSSVDVVELGPRAALAGSAKPVS